jgi:hypothetical protein
MTPNHNPARSGGCCILELATAAAQGDDYEYWTSVRLCSQAFVETMKEFCKGMSLPGQINDDGVRQWQRLQDFLDAYQQEG